MLVYTVCMLLGKKFTSHFSAIRVLIAICFLFVAPLLGNLQASALPMNHDMQSAQNCASICVGNQRTNRQHEATVFQDEKNIPIPPLNEPYYVQFSNIDFPKPLPPQELILSSSFKPPDLNVLHSIFRF